LGAHHATAKRAAGAITSPAYLDGGVSYLAPSSETTFIDRMMSFWQPFETSLWVLLGGVFALAGAVFWYLDENRGQPGKTYTDHVLDATLMFTGRGMGYYTCGGPKTKLGRFVGLFWSTFLLILQYYYASRVFFSLFQTADIPTTVDGVKNGMCIANNEYEELLGILHPFSTYEIVERHWSKSLMDSMIDRMLEGSSTCGGVMYDHVSSRGIN